MKLEKLLSEKQSAVVNRWFELTLETYPADARRFLTKQKDRFANPVGSTLSQEIENTYLELLRGIDHQRVSPILERIIRIRAVQDFTPSKAISFVFLLKQAVREELKKEISGNRLADELQVIDSRIDELALIAFDIFTMCRDKIYEIRVREAKNHVSRLLKKANMIVEISEGGEGPKENNL
jgi:hypothetical protein